MEYVSNFFFFFFVVNFVCCCRNLSHLLSFFSIFIETLLSYLKLLLLFLEIIIINRVTKKNESASDKINFKINSKIKSKQSICNSNAIFGSNSYDGIKNKGYYTSTIPDGITFDALSIISTSWFTDCITLRKMEQASNNLLRFWKSPQSSR